MRLRILKEDKEAWVKRFPNLERWAEQYLEVYIPAYDEVWYGFSMYPDYEINQFGDLRTKESRIHVPYRICRGYTVYEILDRYNQVHIKTSQDLIDEIGKTV